jgi:hypothetical protein
MAYGDQLLVNACPMVGCGSTATNSHLKHQRFLFEDIHKGMLQQQSNPMR